MTTIEWNEETDFAAAVQSLLHPSAEIRNLQLAIADCWTGEKTLPMFEYIMPALWWRTCRTMNMKRKFAVLLTLICLVKYMDARKVIVQTSVNNIAKQTGLHKRRISRALREIRCSGFLTTLRRPIPLQGSRWQTIRTPMVAAVRRINTELFALLGKAKALIMLRAKWKGKQRRTTAMILNDLRARQQREMGRSRGAGGFRSIRTITA